MRKLLFILALSFVSVSVLPSCKNTSLEQGGVYTDKVLFASDQTITATFQVFETFVSWEYNNRVLLESRPEVKKAADYIRVNAKQWRDSLLAVRDAYAAHPTTEGKANLDQILAVVQTALTQAVSYMAVPVQPKA